MVLYKFLPPFDLKNSCINSYKIILNRNVIILIRILALMLHSYKIYILGEILKHTYFFENDINLNKIKIFRQFIDLFVKFKEKTSNKSRNSILDTFEKIKKIEYKIIIFTIN